MDFEDYIASIQRQFDRDEFEEALPLCTKAAALQPDNPIVSACKLFALLNCSKWNDALTLITKQDNQQELNFERAYCLYRLNKFQEALDLIPKGTKDDNWVRLQAQVQYRMGKYSECAETYEKLFKEDSEDTGLLVNALASYVSGDNAQQALSRMDKGVEELLDSSYELSFNLACALIEEGKLDEAEARLATAKQICLSELNDEDVAPEDEELLEDNAELAAIQVQTACVAQRRGRNEEAHEIYTKVLQPTEDSDQAVDVTVLAVACNNVVALRSDGKSLFDSLKRINIASKESLEHKLTRKQTVSIAINKVLLLLQAHKGDEAKREVQNLRKNWPGHPRVLLAAAATSFYEKKYKVCEETLQNFIKENPGNEEVTLSLVQLYAQQNQGSKAVEALTKLPIAMRARPAILKTMVAMMQKQKTPERAVEQIREAIGFWTKKGKGDEHTLAEVLRIASSSAQRLKDSAFAAEAFKLYLEEVDGTDTEALCGLVQALSSTDVASAEMYAQRLKVPSIDHLDPEELEQAAIPKLSRVPKKATGLEGDDDGDAAANEANVAAEKEKARLERLKEKRKRKRKVRYPKNFDPENPGPAPDPERWLPKRERTEYKKRMKKRQKDLQRGPQGSMPVDDNAFRKQGPSTAQTEVASDKNRSRGNRRKK